MEKKTENATITYEPEVINSDTQVTFTKITNASGTTIYGKVEKNGAEVGSISFETKGNYLITTVKPYSELTAEETATIFGSTPDWIQQVLED